jgi:hypothetical protein
VVLDTVGGDTQVRSFAVLKRGGTLASIVAEPDAGEAARRGVPAAFLLVGVTTAHLERVAELIAARWLGLASAPSCRSPRRARPMRCSRARDRGRAARSCCASARDRRYQRPPDATRVSPVIHSERSDARNTATGAMSSGRPPRPSGVCATIAFAISLSRMPAVTTPSVSV